MESNRFSYEDSTRDLIYLKLKNEYIIQDILNFKGFIDSKDIGIKVINNHNCTYEITDKKKWMLAKIKYGF